MKQTAVEWLGEQIKERIVRRNPHDVIVIQTLEETLLEIIAQAKEIEKEQIKAAWLEGVTGTLKSINIVMNEKDIQDFSKISEHYYQDTYTNND